MPESRPTGIATSRPIAVRYRVPQTSGSTPKDCWDPWNSGDHLVPSRKSPIGTSPKNATVSRISDTTIASVVAIDTSAAAKSTARIAPSKRERAEGRRTREVRRPIAPGEAAVETSATVRSRAGAALGLLELGL